MNDSVDVLFELGTEELPPKALRNLSNALAENFEGGLQQNSIHYDRIEPFATPRRLAVIIKGCHRKQTDKEIERRGPAISVAFDQNGTPTPAAQGFARSCGTTVERLERVENEKGQWLSYKVSEPGRTSMELLPEIAQQALHKLPIPKRMRWGDCSSSFIRPVHWVTFLFGGEVVPCKLFDISSDRVSFGHRFHSNGEISLDSTSEYQDRLRFPGYVLLSFEKRKQHIRQQVERLANEMDGIADCDDDLLDEVTALTEWPVAIKASFDSEFLDVPREVLVLTMKQHQRYFPIFSRDGRLLNHFITVANIESKDPEIIRKGNEKVIRPRFADAKFFWDQDRKQTLESRLNRLKQVVFQQKLGSMYEKSGRVAALARDIALLTGADSDKVDRAAWLSRCDLVTETVFEFPEMQGVMGRYLLQREGANPELSQAMDEFYWPRFAGDRIPETRTGIVVSLAEKLETIVSIFAIGEIPTGDKDPFGLRRLALGALRILKERQLKVQLRTALEIAHNRLPEQTQNSEILDTVYEFIIERLRGLYLEQGIDSSVFNAVNKVNPSTIGDFDRRINAVSIFKGIPEAESLAEANKRIRNILRKADFKMSEEIASELFSEEAEIQLYQSISMLERQIEPALESGDYAMALRQLAQLKPSVDRFFDEVMVMAEDMEIRTNRLTLLSKLYTMFLQVADISELQISTRQSN